MTSVRDYLSVMKDSAATGIRISDISVRARLLRKIKDKTDDMTGGASYKRLFNR
jgi:hypothetical protein